MEADKKNKKPKNRLEIAIPRAASRFLFISSPGSPKALAKLRGFCTLLAVRVIYLSGLFEYFAVSPAKESIFVRRSSSPCLFNPQSSAACPLMAEASLSLASIQARRQGLMSAERKTGTKKKGARLVRK